MTVLVRLSGVFLHISAISTADKTVIIVGALILVKPCAFLSVGSVVNVSIVWVWNLSLETPCSHTQNQKIFCTFLHSVISPITLGG